MGRQGYLIAVVGTFLIGCAVLLVVGFSGVQAETSQEEQGHTEATEQEQGHSGGAAPEEDRCEGTRTIELPNWGSVVTNDVPGCPKGGVLSGTDGKDNLHGGEGEHELHGLDGWDVLDGGLDNDVLYGGPGVDLFYGEQGDDVLYGGPGIDDMNGDQGDDVLYGGDDIDFLYGGEGEDVLHAGDGNDHLGDVDGQRDKLYCGGGGDKYDADKIDYVSSSCEKGTLVDTGGPPLILLAWAALLLGSGLVISRHVIRRAS